MLYVTGRTGGDLPGLRAHGSPASDVDVFRAQLWRWRWNDEADRGPEPVWHLCRGKLRDLPLSLCCPHCLGLNQVVYNRSYSPVSISRASDKLICTHRSVSSWRMAMP